ncbi:aldolase/citrate lyase family protein [Tumebacillus sp. DT12]|uniref:Aldolase/citrate lyase family protein n=1 Tax=Tumebacillus lacus TaxID=2995335 RepID=A0ABT3WXP8_9BACL|nr:aldolase/citrate lyase family protein [Tumebacillus lacus]MCX7569439.1 aldolase/citrate lyase family protein [Tumebacillus lacus]
MTTFKQRLRSEEKLYGTWVRIAHPVIVEVLGRSGLDFLQIDMEHAAIGTGELDRLLLAAKATGVPTMVRVPELGESVIGRALDLGATGIVVPRINSAEEAQQAVHAAFFAPVGQRGLGGACRANDYGAASFRQYAAEANERTTLILQIETKEAVERIDEILDASAAATDLYYIGPADLSQSLGVAGQFDDPLLQETIRWVARRIQKRGKAVGIHVPNPSMIPLFAEWGIRYFTGSFDSGLLAEGAKGWLHAMKQQKDREGGY